MQTNKEEGEEEEQEEEEEEKGEEEERGDLPDQQNKKELLSMLGLIEYNRNFFLK